MGWRSERFDATAPCARDLVWLYVSNIVAILATLGLATAWVTIRMARYRARNLYLAGDATPEAFAGTATGVSSATGSQVSDRCSLHVSLRPASEECSSTACARRACR